MLFKDTLRNLMIPTYTMDEDGNLVETVEGSENAYYSTLKAKEVDFTANERQKKKTGFDIKAKDEDFYEFIKKTVKEHFPDVQLRREGDVLIFDEKKIGWQYCDLLKYSEKYFGYKRDTLVNIHQHYLDAGIRILHILSDEWQNRREVCKSIINASMGVFEERYYARKCKVEYLTKEQGIEFFNANHLQGNSSAKWYLGLIYDDKIVCALSISTPRFTNFSDYEVVRYSCRRGAQVIGGFMKCFELFKKGHTGTIVTYSDSRVFSADVYRHNFIEDTTANDIDYFYVNNREKFNRFKFQKYKLVKAYPEFAKVTEHDSAKLLGFFRFYGLKQFRFVYKWNNEEGKKIN